MYSTIVCLFVCKMHIGHELNSNEITHLLKRFPPFELSYETLSHKKVQPDLSGEHQKTADSNLQYYNLGIYIPIGKKFFIWFSFYEKKDVIFLMELNKEKKIHSVFWIENSGCHQLSLGTLFYGTFLDFCQPNSPTLSYTKGVLEEGEPIKSSTFLIEDVFYYQGISLKNIVFSEKLGFIYDFLHLYQLNLPQSGAKDVPLEKCEGVKAPLSCKIHMVLPKLWFRDTEMDPEKPDYPVHHIQYRCLSRISPYINIKQNNFMNKEENPQKEADLFSTFRTDFSKSQYKYQTVFQVTADIQFDIYHLFAYGKNSAPVYYNMAYIPNMRTSIFMNGLFRNIRENKNLDLIEESDDEEDFENICEDKYVDLNKSILMECAFHPKFKKWVPQRVVPKGSRIIHIRYL